MKILYIWSSADFSILDVATGLRSALMGTGIPIVDYRLHQRMRMVQQAFRAAGWVKEDEDIDINSLCDQASEGVPYRAFVNGCDWAFVISGMGLHPNAIAALRVAGVKVACWFTEAPYDSTDDKELSFARLCNVAFVNERSVVGDFQAMMGDENVAVYLPHAYNPEVHKRCEPDPEHTSDVLFVGTGFDERVHLFETINWENIDFRFGGFFPYVSEPSHLAKYLRYPCLDNRMLPMLYSGAKVALNPHRYHPTAESLNPRAYEIAACGTFQIADYRGEAVDVFGDSIPTYEPGVPWQMEALVRKYLADPATRDRMAEEARRRVQPHTFAARARVILDTLAEYDRQKMGKRLQLVS